MEGEFGLKATVDEPDAEDPQSWRVVCETTAIVSPDFVRDTGNFFDRLAERHLAEYDGWEAAAQP
jgi:hypothetical protein